MNTLRSNLRSIPQSICAIVGFSLLNWSISLLRWAGEQRLADSLSIVCAGMDTEMEAG